MTESAVRARPQDNMADMSLSTSQSSCDNQESEANTALSMRDQMRETKLPFNFYSDSDLMSKRKLDQVLRGSRVSGAWELEMMQSDDHVKRICRGNSVSGSTNTDVKDEIFRPQCGSLMSGSSLTNEDKYQGKQCCPHLTFPNDMKSYTPLSDTDESVHGLSSSSVEKPDFYEATPLEILKECDYHFKKKDECDSELEKALRLSVVDELRKSVASAHPTASLRSEERIPKAIQLLRIAFADGMDFQRSVPIGCDFQAEIPEWIGPVNKKKLSNEDEDSVVSRWSGTRMWPNERQCGGVTIKAIGKGRPESCSCVSPGSVDCVKHHIHETRLCLKSEIGPAFCSWKFDEMGEFASESWTSKEQRTFESLVRKNPLSKYDGFWKLAFKRFPDKPKKSIVSYYYNVFIPRRMSLATRSSIDKIDSDED